MVIRLGLEASNSEPTERGTRKGEKPNTDLALSSTARIVWRVTCVKASQPPATLLTGHVTSTGTHEGPRQAAT